MISFLSLLLQLFALASSAKDNANLQANPLQSWAYEIFPVGSFVPQGWLEKELIIQANGLSGHLSLFWPDIANSTWIGGTADLGLRERAPYWLNGMTPLSFLLPNSQEYLTVDIQKQTWKYISYILNNQSSDGWLGPSSDIETTGGDAYWARFNVLNSLRMYAEGISDTNITLSNDIKTAMLKFILCATNLMTNTVAMSGWAAARYMDYILSIHWLIDQSINDENNNNNGWKLNDTMINTLLSAAKLAKEQGFEWENWFENELPHEPVPASETTLYTHGVNNGQALKSAAVWYRQTKNETLRQLSQSRMERMDEYHGQATGMFGCDEHLAGRMPSRGTELCTVVESMYSYAIMFRVFGDVKYLDRLERIAINALPATFASPAGGDMWSHQYLQQNNEINAIYSNPHVWATDGPNSTIYGLEPNYGCCTANFNQGWPKYTFSIFYMLNNRTEAAIGIYSPGYIKYPNTIGNGASINITTNYPFEDDIIVYIDNSKEFNLWIRVPTWTTNSTVILNGNNHILTYNDTDNVKGTMYKIEIPAISYNNNKENVLYINWNAKFRIYSGYNGSVALLRGSVLYSLAMGELFQTVAVHPYQSKDYEIVAETSWKYALVLSDFDDLEKDIKFINNGYVAGHAPFNRSNIATEAWVNAVSISDWNIENNAAQSPPTSPVCSNGSVILDENDGAKYDGIDSNNKQKSVKYGDTICGAVEQIKLIPHGCTDLRIAEFPLAYKAYNDTPSIST